MAASPITVPTAPLRAFLIALFGRCDLPALDAAVLADRLLEAHFRGFDTHGMSCVAPYCANFRERRINPRPNLAIEPVAPWAARVDCDNGIGHVAATRAMEWALGAAERVGIGVALLRRSNHFGAACLYPLLALPKGCIGIAMANAAPNVAPFGAGQPLLGTNPLAVAVPAGRHPPFVMDFATSTVARRKLRQEMEAGRPIPADWAIDAEGRPTTDPKAAMEGALLAFGGAKGSALGLLIDILSGVLSGAAFGGEPESFYTNHTKPVNSGSFLAAIRIDVFMPRDEFAARMDELIDRVHALRPADGVDRVRIPGERGAAWEPERRRDGIPLGHATLEELRGLGRSLGVPFPA